MRDVIYIDKHGIVQISDTTAHAPATTSPKRAPKISIDSIDGAACLDCMYCIAIFITNFVELFTRVPIRHRILKSRYLNKSLTIVFFIKTTNPGSDRNLKLFRTDRSTVLGNGI